MLKRIQKAELKASLLGIVLLLLLGIGLIGLSGVHKLIAGPTPLQYLDAEQLEDEYVCYDMWLSFDTFAEMVTTIDGKEISDFKDYVIPVESYYVAVRIYPKDYEKMNQFIEDSYAWMDYKTDDLPEVFPVKGVIEKMSQDELTYYYEFLELSEAEAPKYGYLPYILDTSKALGTNLSPVLISVMLMGGLVLLGIAIWKVYTIKTMKHHQDLLSLLQEKPEMEDYLEKWMSRENDVYGLRINESWCWIHTDKMTKLLPSSDVLWMYMKVTTHRVNFIPVRKDYQCKIWTKKGREITIPMRMERDVNLAIQYAVNQCPHIVAGYSKELEQLYLQSIDE